MQCDEKWSFVGRKEKNVRGDPADPAAPGGGSEGDRGEGDRGEGDRWDHVAFDPEHRLVLGVVVGPRTAQSLAALLAGVKRRLGGRVPALITTDEYPAYEAAVLATWGDRVVPLPQCKPGRRALPYRKPPAGLTYAAVHKTRKKGRVVKVERRVVFGSDQSLAAALAGSAVSTTANTSFVERHNATDRHRNARKARKTYRFSKDTDVHDAMTLFTLYSYNFCWPVRTLREKGPNGNWLPRTPAMAAGLADRVWSIRDWVTLPAIQSA